MSGGWAAETEAEAEADAWLLEAGVPELQEAKVTNAKPAAPATKDRLVTIALILLPFS